MAEASPDRQQSRGARFGMIGALTLGTLLAVPSAGSARAPAGAGAESPSARWAATDTSRAGGAAEDAGARGRWGFGLSAGLAVPRGEFASHVDESLAVGFHFFYPLDAAEFLGLRLEGAVVPFARERRRARPTSTLSRIRLEVNTVSRLFTFGAGPQLTLPTKRIRPFGTATVGIGHFSTASTLREPGKRRGDRPLLHTPHFDHTTFAWAAGGGVLVTLADGPMSLLGVGEVRYHDHGRSRYLRPADIRETRDGALILEPTESEANLLMVRIGIAFAF